MAYNITKEQVLNAIKGSAGIITTIQKRLSAAIEHNVSWTCTKEYTEKWEVTREAMEAERQTTLDVAEGTIVKEIYNNNPEMAKWYLKMKGKDRGYVETQEIQMANKDPLNINLNGDMQNAKDLMDSPMVEVSNDEGTGEE